MSSNLQECADAAAFLLAGIQDDTEGAVLMVQQLDEAEAKQLLLNLAVVVDMAVQAEVKTGGGGEFLGYLVRTRNHPRLSARNGGAG